MPVLTTPAGKTAGMSRSLLRYLAKKVQIDGHSLYPDDDDDALLVDEVSQLQAMPTQAPS